MNNFLIYSYYRFVNVRNKKEIKIKIENFIKGKKLRGTILLANEGINGSISGQKKDLDKLLRFIKNTLNIRKVSLKINEVSFLPFNRLKVRLKKEIVSLGKGEILPDRKSINYINPSEWNSFLEQEELALIDLRNIYEIKIGKFKNALDPKTNSFRDFPKKIEEMNLNKNHKIGIYCTGGIRCEKASKYLSIKGYKNIYQLEGGVLNYLDFIKNNKLKSKWNGECFVFDNRVSVDSNLKPGKYLQCHGCRSPISANETKSKTYIKGVSCKYCYNKRTEEQKKRSMNRQQQIYAAENKNITHPFKKITSDNF